MRWGVRRSESYGPNKESVSSKIKRATPDQMTKAKSVTDHSTTFAKEGVNINRSIGDIRSARRKEDLSGMSDVDLRNKIARMNLEQQYSTLNGGQVSKGQTYAKGTLEVAGSVLAIGSSAIGIALAVKQLKGG